MSYLVKLAGGAIIVDGVGSIALSTDQRPVSNAGRVVRTAIGIMLIFFG